MTAKTMIPTTNWPSRVNRPGNGNRSGPGPGFHPEPTGQAGLNRFRMTRGIRYRNGRYGQARQPARRIPVTLIKVIDDQEPLRRILLE